MFYKEERFGDVCIVRKMTRDMMLSLHIVSFRNQSCMLNSCGNILSFLINGAFLNFWHFSSEGTALGKKKKKSLILLIAMYVLGFGELASPPRENSREPSSMPGSGCWLSFSSVSTAALLPPTPIPSCKLTRLFLLLAAKKTSNSNTETGEGLAYYGIGGSQCMDIRG